MTTFKSSILFFDKVYSKHYQKRSSLTACQPEKDIMLEEIFLEQDVDDQCFIGDILSFESKEEVDEKLEALVVHTKEVVDDIHLFFLISSNHEAFPFMAINNEVCDDYLTYIQRPLAVIRLDRGFRQRFKLFA